MKKIFTVILCFLLVLSSLVACKNQTPETTKVTVTFVQQGQANVVYTVNKGESLLNVPDPIEVAGYEVSWDVQNYANLQQDVTATAVLTPKTYVITLKETLSNKGFSVNIPTETVSVKYMESLDGKLPQNVTCKKYGETYEFLYWADKDGNRFEKENYDIADNLTLYAIFNIEYA